MKSTGMLTVVAAAVGLLVPGVALADSVKLKAALTGAAETGGGAVGGTGNFTAEIDESSGDVCYEVTVGKVPGANMAHIHKGKAGEDGAPVVTLAVTGADGEMCMAAQPEVLAPIIAAPGDYYVNVHSAAFPKGAVRGQLEKVQ